MTTHTTTPQANELKHSATWCLFVRHMVAIYSACAGAVVLGVALLHT